GPMALVPPSHRHQRHLVRRRERHSRHPEYFYDAHGDRYVHGRRPHGPAPRHDVMEPTIAPARGGGILRSLPPVVLVLGSITSTQIGAALAKDIFPIIGTRATVLLRVGSAALLLLAVARPRLSGEWRLHMGVVALFGTILGVMNFM